MRLIATLLVLVTGPVFAQTCPVAPTDPVPRDQARLEWTRPATYTDGTSTGTTVLTYTVYRRSGTTDTLACTTTAVSAGQLNLAVGTHTWVVTARVGTGPESVKSNAASKTVPEPIPNPPVLTVTSTLVGDSAWKCQDETGALISSHVRPDKAQESCTNQALANVGTAYEVHPGGFLRIVAR